MLYEILYLLSFKAENECLSADELAPKIPVHTDKGFINTYIEQKLKRQNEIHLSQSAIFHNPMLQGSMNCCSSELITLLLVR